MFSFCSNARIVLGFRGSGSCNCSVCQALRGCAAVRREPEVRAGLLARLDARADQDLERLRLFERIDRVVADPDELERRLVHALADHMVERVLHPRLQRHQPLLRRLLAHRLAGRAVDLAHERRDGHREGVADEARQPLVVLVLERRLARLDQLEVGRHELVWRLRARLPLISASK